MARGNCHPGLLFATDFAGVLAQVQLLNPKRTTNITHRWNERIIFKNLNVRVMCRFFFILSRRRRRRSRNLESMVTGRIISGTISDHVNCSVTIKSSVIKKWIHQLGPLNYDGDYLRGYMDLRSFFYKIKRRVIGMNSQLCFVLRSAYYPEIYKSEFLCEVISSQSM